MCQFDFEDDAIKQAVPYESMVNYGLFTYMICLPQMYCATYCYLSIIIVVAQIDTLDHASALGNGLAGLVKTPFSQ